MNQMPTAEWQVGFSLPVGNIRQRQTFLPEGKR